MKQPGNNYMVTLGQIETTFSDFWDNFGTPLRQIWDNFQTTLEQLMDQMVTAKWQRLPLPVGDNITPFTHKRAPKPIAVIFIFSSF